MPDASSPVKERPLSLWEKGRVRGGADWLPSRILFLLLLMLGTAAAPAGEVLVSQVDHERGLYRIELDMRLDAGKGHVWRLLTDYAHYGQLNDAIRESEVLQRQGPGSHRVRTVTRACVYFFCKTVRQVQDVTEVPGRYISASVLPGQSDFRYGVARVYVWPEGAHTRVRLLAEVEPDFWIPPLIGPWIIGRKLQSEALETMRNVERLAGPGRQ
jgi:hypothetical protein